MSIPITVGSLFSGFDGMALGLERAGMKIVWQCEINPYCRKVLKKHRPDVPCYDDIRTLENPPHVDLICAGFPCQDLSNAGKRAGIEGEQSGLWRDNVRIIRVVRPRYVLLENVAALLSCGMGRVLGDLAECGYDAGWRVFKASDVGAPHLRKRVFILAYNDRSDRMQGYLEGEISRQPAFSWCENVRNVEDLRERPDIPEPLIWRNGNGVSQRLHGLGNAVIPQISEWIGKRIIESDNGAKCPYTL